MYIRSGILNSCLVFLIDKKHFRAQERLSVTQKTGEREIARLTALLRKSEMSVASMEDKIKLKVYRYIHI